MGRTRVDESKPGRPCVIVGPEDGEHTASVLLLHGLGDTARGWQDAAERWSRALPHVRFILPTAQVIRVTMNGGACQTAWIDLQMRSPQDFLQAIMMRPRKMGISWHELLSIIARESSEFGVPSSRIVIAGFSLGAHMALWTGLQLPAPGAAGIVCMSGMLFGSSNCAITDAGKQTKVLFCHGEQDQVIPGMGSAMTREHLEKAGCTVAGYRTFPMGHSACPEEIQVIEDFLASVLPAAEPGAKCELTVGDLAEAPLDLHRVPDGASVTVNGTSKAELNGQVFTVVGHDAEKQRYLLTQPGRSPLSLAGDKMTQHAAATLGDRAVTIVDFDREQNRFQLRGEAEEWAAPGDLRLPNGTVVSPHGLTSAKGSQLNGLYGTILSFSEENGRYMVSFDGDHDQVALRPESVRP